MTATGRNGESVTSSPAGINVAVGTTGSASFTTGASITLSVTNGRDAIWSGACSSGARPTFFTSTRYASFGTMTSVASTTSPGATPSSSFVSRTLYGIVIAGIRPLISSCLIVAS